MALKGTTRIELTNVKTGQTEVIERDNLVTNAAMLAMTQNPLGVLYQNTSGWFTKNMLPLCPNAVGGILCFEDAIEESVDQLYPPVGNHMVACSSNDVNPGESTTRGSMNQTESGPLEDWTGYRFVFDFGTDQSNGTISSVCLTSKWGGIAGMGDIWDGKSWFQNINTYRSAAWNGTNEDMYAWRHIKTLDVSNNIAYSVYMDYYGDVHITKLPMQLSKLNLVHPGTEPLFHPNWNAVTYEYVEMPDTIKNLTEGNDPSKRHNAYIHDGHDGYWWVLSNAGNSSGDATVYYAKISQADYSVEEGSFVVQGAKLSPCGRFGGIGFNNNSERVEDISYSAMANGKLYVMNYNKNGIYEIDLPSGIPLREITSPYSMTNLENTGYPQQYLRNVAGFIMNSGCLIGGDDVVYRSVARGNIYDNNTVLDGPYAISTTYKAGSVDASTMTVGLFAPYLATINNLPTPVQKTADKTMKITYILREEM